MNDNSNPKLEPGKTLLVYPMLNEIAEGKLEKTQKAVATLQIAGNTIHVVTYSKEKPERLVPRLLRISGYPPSDDAKQTGWIFGNMFEHESTHKGIPSGTCWEILDKGRLVGYGFIDGQAIKPEQAQKLIPLTRSERGIPQDRLTFDGFDWVNN